MGNLQACAVHLHLGYTLLCENDYRGTIRTVYSLLYKNEIFIITATSNPYRLVPYNIDFNVGLSGPGVL
jgi:hypothetical protein